MAQKMQPLTRQTNSKEYWEKRETENIERNKNAEAEIEKRTQEILQSTYDRIQKEINGFYGKYARSEGITMAEAKKRISKLDIAEYERKAKRYVEEHNFTQKANEEMRLYNATMKINRLELLKSNIGLELAQGYSELENLYAESLDERAREEFKRQAGILGKGVENPKGAAHEIATASFRNATFSDRIWANQSMLKSELDSLLREGLIQGKNPRVLARHIEKRFGVEKYKAERLMRTEMARVQIAAQQASYLKNGYDSYMYIAEPSACTICKAMSGEVFLVSGMQTGSNAPPMHPNCRCSTAAYMDRSELDNLLDSEKGTYIESIKRIGTNDVDLNYIKSDSFRKKFSTITDNASVNDSIRRYATAMLTHRNGTDGEDLYIIDSNGKLLLRKIAEKNELGVTITRAETQKIREKGKCISIHNHPTNIKPTGSDFAVAGYRKYDFGVVVTHDGHVYKYSVGNRVLTAGILDNRIDKYTKNPYNLSVKDAHNKALDDLKKEYGISCEELK